MGLRSGEKLTKRIGRLVRGTGVMLIRTLGGPGLVGTGGLASGLVSWRAGVLILAIALAGGVLRLFTEWQRRKTFTALIPHVPEGTVIVQQDGLGRQTMTVTLGGSHRCAPGPPGDHE
jgi:hypothetical protein